jgi:hypothetical protein
MTRRSLIAAAFAAAALALLTSGDLRQPLVVGDFSGALGPKGAPAGWKLVKYAGTPRLGIETVDGRSALVMRSESASFGLDRELSVDLSSRPVLSWSWRADELPPRGDFRARSTDDQAAQLYVLFSRTRAVAYIWDTNAPLGASGDSPSAPPFSKGKILVLRSGRAEAGRWVEERRDLLADYRLLFGEAPPVAPGASGARAIGMRLLINSQHTSSAAACAFADIVFSGD